MNKSPLNLLSFTLMLGFSVVAYSQGNGGGSSQMPMSNQGSSLPPMYWFTGGVGILIVVIAIIYRRMTRDK